MLTFLPHTKWFVGSQFPSQIIEPWDTDMKGPSPNHWTAREFPNASFFIVVMKLSSSA